MTHQWAMAAGLAMGVTTGTAACTHHDPPAWDAGPGGDGVVVATVVPAASTTAVTAADGGASATDLDASTDPATLPQTTDRPSSEDAAFEARMQALWDAIVADDAARAEASFFPKAAYEQVKAIATPGRDWTLRLKAAFARDIHDRHGALATAKAPRYLGVAVPDERARWVKPGEEGNKLGYYRVFGTRLRYEAGGRERAVEVKSLISWRGEWFVVHLSSFK